ncbi:Uncharacterised protein [Mycobacteroides abscessus subsp. abscessus]|nr:Uncharacterised protein [Mycobacteroides abscessus subsp. abscessus]
MPSDTAPRPMRSRRHWPAFTRRYSGLIALGSTTPSSTLAETAFCPCRWLRGRVHAAWCAGRVTSSWSRRWPGWLRSSAWSMRTRGLSTRAWGR